MPICKCQNCVDEVPTGKPVSQVTYRRHRDRPHTQQGSQRTRRFHCSCSLYPGTGHYFRTRAALSKHRKHSLAISAQHGPSECGSHTAADGADAGSDISALQNDSEMFTADFDNDENYPESAGTSNEENEENEEYEEYEEYNSDGEDCSPISVLQSLLEDEISSEEPEEPEEPSLETGLGSLLSRFSCFLANIIYRKHLHR